MRSLTTTPKPNSLHQQGYRQGAFARLGGMRVDQRNRQRRELAANGTGRARSARPVRVGEAQVDRPPSFTREDLLTADNVADILQIKRSTALDYMRRGVIPARKVGRRWYALRSRLDAHIGDLFDFGPYR